MFGNRDANLSQVEALDTELPVYAFDICVDHR